MYPNYCYPITEGEFGNPLASSYLRPITQHLDELCQKYPTFSAWLRNDRVTFLDRSITFEVPAGQTVVQAFNVGGGFDALVFSRNASAVRTAPPAGGFAFDDLPSEQAGYVELQIARKSGPIDTEQCPIGNTMGFGWLPNPRPPEFWAGADIREFLLVNNTVNDVKVVVTFTLVLL